PLGPFHRAGREVHLPRVQRTDHRRAGDDAVAEGPASVRAAVPGREEAVPEVEHRNMATVHENLAPFARGEAVARRQPHAVMAAHVSVRPARSSAVSGTNCVGCLGACPSSHASRARAFERCSRSLKAARTASGAYTVSLRTFSMPRRATKS